MKAIHKLAIVAAMLLTAATSSAQRDHGPVGDTMSGGGMGSGTRGDMSNSGMGGMSLLVAPDGTAITTSVTLNTTTNVYATSVVAVSSTGSIAWRWAAPAGIHRLELAGNLVLVSGGQMHHDGTTTSNVELTALALGNGAVAWKTALPGFAMAIEPAANQIVVLTVQRYATGGGMGGGMGSGMGGGSNPGTPGSGTGSGGTGMMNGARTLVALSNSGVILWSVPLSQ